MLRRSNVYTFARATAHIGLGGGLQLHPIALKKA